MKQLIKILSVLLTSCRGKVKENHALKLLLIFPLLILVACQPIMMKMYGIKDPDIENEKTITKKIL